jgi:hypothetical protein
MSTALARQTGLAAPAPVLPTSDGGARQPDADLWCSYAAVRALTWLGGRPADPASVAEFLLSRQNADGGFSWQRGLRSDVWATYYCAQALRDLGYDVPDLDRLAGWLDGLRTADGGFAMTAGQSADIWATYYATRLYAEVLGRPVPDLDRLAGWLARTQHDGAGLSWAPGSTQVDVRACYYGALAWRAAAGDRPAPWDVAALVAWLQDRQDAAGGFAFTPGAAPCAWAAFRALHALRALGAAPRDPAAAAGWLNDRRLPDGGYERWPGYAQADVWACFCVAGALAALDLAPDPAAAQAAVDFVRSCQLPGSGFTYRHPAAAGDSLATAAALLLEPHSQSRGDQVAWLRRAQTPYEGGVMYMPGRGAEVRCTLWAAEALGRAGTGLDPDRLRDWLTSLQNPDGGVGYWVGRGSDLVSTASAVEIAVAAGLIAGDALDAEAAARFLDACRAGDGYGPTPGADPTLPATAQAARALDALGHSARALAVARSIPRWASRLGGYSATPRAVPDLLSTYQAILTLQVFGLPWEADPLRQLLRKLRVDDGCAWSPLSRRSGGPLATCLGRLLEAAADGDGDRTPLPRLSL